MSVFWKLLTFFVIGFLFLVLWNSTNCSYEGFTTPSSVLQLKKFQNPPDNPVILNQNSAPQVAYFAELERSLDTNTQPVMKFGTAKIIVRPDEVLYQFEKAAGTPATTTGGRTVVTTINDTFIKNFSSELIPIITQGNWQSIDVSDAKINAITESLSLLENTKKLSERYLANLKDLILYLIAMYFACYVRKNLVNGAEYAEKLPKILYLLERLNAYIKSDQSLLTYVCPETLLIEKTLEIVDSSQFMHIYDYTSPLIVTKKDIKLFRFSKEPTSQLNHIYSGIPTRKSGWKITTGTSRMGIFQVKVNSPEIAKILVTSNFTCENTTELMSTVDNDLTDLNNLYIGSKIYPVIPFTPVRTRKLETKTQFALFVSENKLWIGTANNPDSVAGAFLQTPRQQGYFEHGVILDTNLNTLRTLFNKQNLILQQLINPEIPFEPSFLQTWDSTIVNFIYLYFMANRAKNIAFPDVSLYGQLCEFQKNVIDELNKIEAYLFGNGNNLGAKIFFWSRISTCIYLLLYMTKQYFPLAAPMDSPISFMSKINYRGNVFKLPENIGTPIFPDSTSTYNSRKPVYFVSKNYFGDLEKIKPFAGFLPSNTAPPKNPDGSYNNFITAGVGIPNWQFFSDAIMYQL